MCGHTLKLYSPIKYSSVKWDTISLQKQPWGYSNRKIIITLCGRTLQASHTLVSSRNWQMLSFIARDLKTFNPQAPTNMVWAYAKSGDCDTRLFKKAAEAVIAGDLRKYKPHGLANIAWAYVKAGEMGALDSCLSKEVANSAIARDLDTFKPQALSNIAWAYVSVGESNTRIFKKMARAVTARDQETFNRGAFQHSTGVYCSWRVYPAPL